MPACARFAHFEHRLADRDVFLRKQLVDVAADHHGDEARFRHLGDGLGRDGLAVAQHGHAVGDLEDLVHAVADVDDADPLRAQRAHDVEETAYVGLGQRRGRLVHDERARVLRQGARDLDTLAVGDRQAGDGRVDVEVGAVEPVEDLAGTAAHLRPVQRAARRARGMADEDVLGHGERREEQEFLVDHGDSAVLRIARPIELARPPVDLHRAGVRLVRARHDADHGGLAGAVLAHQGMDLAGAQIEIDAFQHRDGAEGLLDRPKRDDGRGLS